MRRRRMLRRALNRAAFLALLMGISAAGCTRMPGVCDDGERNGDESDVDCGGPTCGGCGLEAFCFTDGDCGSGVCALSACVEAGCGDGKQNGDETDVDCGGSCGPCAAGDACAAAGDCQSGRCDAGACAAPTCSDGLMNGSETDADCGGPDCATCALGAGCRLNVDCDSGGCFDGSCVEVSCALPLETCGSECVDPRYDPQFCGDCVTSCGPTDVCSSGACLESCPPGTTSCLGSCVNTDSDVLNCGACGNPCAQGERCEAGACVLSCGPGQTECGGECVFTDTAGDHCGGCFQPCQPDEVCSMGACSPGGSGSCDPPLTVCDGGSSCANLQVDPDRCGDCSNVCQAVMNADRTCTDGMCGRGPCYPGFGSCDFLPANGCETDLMTTDTDCGACGVACGSGTTCISGTCQ